MSDLGVWFGLRKSLFLYYATYSKDMYGNFNMNSLAS